MNTTTRNLILSTLIVILALGAALWLLRDTEHKPQHTEAHDHGAEEDVAKGPHGGRLLQEGGFALELTIFERGVPPEFHVYAYLDGEPLAPEAYTLNIELARLDGQIDRFDFTAQGDYLKGEGVVVEPHSFDVTVKASHRGRDYQWQYENYEGRTHIARAMAEQGGIETEAAGAAVIYETLMLTGRVHTDPARLSQVRARYPGIVRSVHRRQGETVRAGEVLATVQSNESLQTYTLKAPIAGRILKSDIQVGEATGDAVLFVIADLSEVWVEFDVFAKDIDRVKTGQTIALSSPADMTSTAPIIWISPLAAHESQSVRARVALANPEGALRPGQLVSARLSVAEHRVPLAVRTSAIQGFRDFQVVFARIDETYEVRMLELGRRDSQWVEVLGGLKPGTEYVTQNSYLIKADIEKSGASHDH